MERMFLILGSKLTGIKVIGRGRTADISYLIFSTHPWHCNLGQSQLPRRTRCEKRSKDQTTSRAYNFLLGTQPLVFEMHMLKDMTSAVLG